MYIYVVPTAKTLTNKGKLTRISILTNSQTRKSYQTLIKIDVIFSVRHFLSDSKGTVEVFLYFSLVLQFGTFSCQHFYIAYKFDCEKFFYILCGCVCIIFNKQCILLYNSKQNIFREKAKILFNVHWQVVDFIDFALIFSCKLLFKYCRKGFFHVALCLH